MDVSDDVLTFDASERELIDLDTDESVRDEDEPEAGSDDEDEEVDALAAVEDPRSLPAGWDPTYVFGGAAAYLVSAFVPNHPLRYTLEELMWAIIRNQPLERNLDWSFDAETDAVTLSDLFERVIERTILLRSIWPVTVEWANWPSYLMDVRAPFLFGARRLFMGGELGWVAVPSSLVEASYRTFVDLVGGNEDYVEETVAVIQRACPNFSRSAAIEFGVL